MSAWDTPLGRWRLEWDAYLAGRPVDPPPVVQPDAPRPEETCADEVAADAAVEQFLAELTTKVEA